MYERISHLQNSVSVPLIFLCFCMFLFFLSDFNSNLSKLNGKLYVSFFSLLFVLFEQDTYVLYVYAEVRGQLYTFLSCHLCVVSRN